MAESSTSAGMKAILFLLGVVLIVVSFVRPWGADIRQNTLILFGFLILIALFDDLQEFNFLGLRGKKGEKELERLRETINTTQEATNPTSAEMDDLTKLRTQSVQLMSVDRGNFLALVFEIERLLRLVASLFFPDKVNDKTPPRKIGELLRGNDYLTENGLNQFKALLEIRNLIVHGKVNAQDDNQLAQWLELAYKLYSEVLSDINHRDQAKAQATTS